jgi:hypothetical protein
VGNDAALCRTCHGAGRSLSRQVATRRSGAAFERPRMVAPIEVPRRTDLRIMHPVAHRAARQARRAARRERDLAGISLAVIVVEVRNNQPGDDR